MKAIPATRKALKAIALVMILLAGTACQSSPAAKPIPPSPTAETVSSLPAVLPSPSATPPSAAPMEASPPPSAAEDQAVAPATVAPTAATTSAPPEPAATDLTELARADLAGRLNLPLEAILVHSVEPVDWPDAGLGCPQAGDLVAPVITPGFRILLEAEGISYVYHSDLGERLVLCSTLDSGPAEPAAEGLPYFVEVVQAVLLNDASAIGPGYNETFAYLAENRTLLVAPRLAVAPATELLVGVATLIQSADQTLVSGDLYQVPPLEAGELELLSFDPATGAFKLRYGEEVLELLPGQSRSFKEAGSDGGVLQVTTLTHHGRLAAIEPLPGTR